ncbi:unnamed protein product [Peniophora sp. CBMAI 1063]|nr:unnamed protein product [Peniophora sp. CBMAI 1063]
MSSSESNNDELAHAKATWLSVLDARIPPEGHILSPDSAGKVDDEMKLLDEITVIAKRRRNGHVSWLCRLPVEVIALILTEVKGSWEPGMIGRPPPSTSTDLREHDVFWGLEAKLPLSESRKATHDRLGWLNVTFVCTMLRKVALALPSLWCDINCHTYALPFQQIFEKRSAGQPLRLLLKFCADDVSIAWAQKWLTSSTCPRLHGLEVSDCSATTFVDLMASLPILPNLTDISLSLLRLPPGVDMKFPLASPQQLSHLSFRDCFPIPPNPVYSPRLTHLTLSSSLWANHTRVPSIKDLINILSSATGLEHLRLEHVPKARLRKHERPPPYGFPLPSSFRKLECLVSEDVVPATDFLNCVQIPYGVEVVLETDSLSDKSEHCMVGISDFARLVDVAFKASQSTHDSPWSLVLTLREAYLLRGDKKFIPGVRSLADLNPRMISARSGMLTRATRPLGSELTDGDLNGLFQLLPVENLTSLTISEDMTDAFFADDFSFLTQSVNRVFAAPAVRHLTVELTANTTHIFAKLAQTHVEDARNNAVVFPFLKTIGIIVGSNAPVESDDNSHLQESLAPVFAAMAAAVNARQHCSVPIDELRVDRELRTFYAWESVTGARVVMV